MYRAKLSGSITVNGNHYRYDAGALIDEPKGSLPEDRFELMEPKEADKSQVNKPVKKGRPKKNA